MLKRILILGVLLFFSSCSPTDNEPEDRLQGYYAPDPLINFRKYYTEQIIGIIVPGSKIIDTLYRADTLLLSVSEFNRSDGKPCPAKGSSLYFSIETAGGDKEIYSLSDSTNWILHQDDLTPYIKFIPFSFAPPQINDEVLEINNNSDVIVTTYSSYWHGHVVKDTLIYRKDTV